MYKKSLAFAIVVLVVGAGIVSSNSTGTNFYTEKSKIISTLDEGLVGYWSFNEVTGNILYDSSGNNNDGTIYGEPAWVDGVSGKALYFDGVDDYVDLGNPASLNPQNEITVAAWYKTVSFDGGNYPIVDKGYYSHTYPWYQYHLGVTGDLYYHEHAEFTWYASAGGEENECNTVEWFWTPGNWYYIVGTYNGSMLSLYVNISNVMTLTGSLITSGMTMQDYGKNVFIAKNSNWDCFTPGTIDEVRIYNRALSEGEIQFLYDNPGGDEPPVANFTYTIDKLSVIFNASSSYDPDGNITNWSWNFGDGNTGIGEIVNYDYLTSGTYNVTLTVVDDDGAEDSFIQTISVANYQSAFVFGRITNLTSLGEYIQFEAVKTRVFTFSPLSFNTYLSGEKFSLSKDYKGFIGLHFMFASCKILI